MQEALGRTRDGPGVGLELVHERFHGGRDRWPIVVVRHRKLGIEKRSNPFLKVETQLVLSPPRRELQRRPQPQNEVDGVGHGVGLPGRHLAKRLKLGRR